MAKKPLAMKVDHVSMKFNLSSEKVDNGRCGILTLMSARATG